MSGPRERLASLIGRFPRAFEPIIAALFGAIVCTFARKAFRRTTPPSAPAPPSPLPKPKADAVAAPRAASPPVRPMPTLVTPAEPTAPLEQPSASPPAPSNPAEPRRTTPRPVVPERAASPSDRPIHEARPEADRYSELCDQACRGSPGADGLTAAAWIDSLSTEEERATEQAGCLIPNAPEPRLALRLTVPGLRRSGSPRGSARIGELCHLVALTRGCIDTKLH